METNSINTFLAMRNRMFARTEAQKISALIREKYSQDAEFAILRQKDTKHEEYAEYNTYCEECKTKVKSGEYDKEMKVFREARLNKKVVNK